MKTKQEVLDMLAEFQAQEQQIKDTTSDKAERIYRAGRVDAAIIAIGLVEHIRTD